MNRLTRRSFLRNIGVGMAAVALSACGATPTATPVPPTPTKPAPTNTPVPPTATKAPAAPTAAPTAVPPTVTAAPAAAAKRPNGDTTSAAWLLDGSGGIALPIAKDKLTLTYWTALASNAASTMKSYNDIACYVEQEKRTNIHLDFQHPAVGQDRDAFNLLLASRKFPDIIEYNWTDSNVYPGGPTKAIADGVLVRLNNLIEQYAPNLKNCLDKNPDWRKQVVTDTGDIYGFPFIRSDAKLLVTVGPTIRGDWLKKLNIPTPETIDDWHNMLVAFKTKDPNGNGKADEVPFTPAWSTGFTNQILAFNKAKAFVGAYGTDVSFYQVKGVVKYGPLDPQFKDFLKTMAQWYKEGLIDPDWVNMDAKLRDARITGSQLGSLIAYGGSGIGTYTTLMAGKEPAGFQLVGAPYPVLKKGDPVHLAHKDPNAPGTATAAITTGCKTVREAMQLLDYAYSYDGNLLFNFGVEGLSYTWVNGFPTYTAAVLKNPQYPVLGVAGSRFCRSSFSGPFVQDVRYVGQFTTLPEQVEATANWSKPINDYWMPPVTPNADEAKSFAKIMNDINTLFAEALTKTIIGEVPVDNWDKTVAQMKQLGIDDAVKIEQAALDRYNKR